MKVFDSSAIYKAITLPDLAVLAGVYTVPLALYELGNAVLTNSTVHKKYSFHEAQELLKICKKALDGMKLIVPNDLPYVYQIATRYNLSFYDAAYVCLAKELNISLITLDKKLQNKARSFADIVLFEDFVK